MATVSATAVASASLTGTARRSGATLLLFLAGTGSVLQQPSSAVAMFCLGSLALYAWDAVRKEALAWLLMITALAVSAHSGGWSAIARGLSQAAAYGSLMLAISFVQPAARSSLIAEILSRWLLQLRGSAANVAVHILGHVGGAALNLSGLIIGLAALHKSVPRGEDATSAATSLLRGFAAAPVWSPYSYFAPLMLAAFPSLSWMALLLLGGLIAGPLLVVSLLSRPRPVIPDQAGTEARGSKETALHWTISDGFRLLAFASFFAAVVWMLTESGYNSLTVTVVALPALAFTWGLCESAFRQQPLPFLADMRSHVVHRIPALRAEVLNLAAAGLMAEAARGQDAWLHWLAAIGHASGASSMALALVLFASIVLLTCIGINPILFLAPLATISLAPDGAALPPAAAVAIICCAWALFPTISPYSAATLVVSREIGADPSTLAFRINRQYNVRAFMYCVTLVAAASWLAGA